MRHSLMVSGVGLSIFAFVTSAKANPCPSKLRKLLGHWGSTPAVLALKRGLSLRYQVTTEGLEAIPKGDGGILFLPNHPGYTDPAIQYTTLFHRFHTRPVAYEGEVNRKGPLGWLVRQTNPLVVPDPAKNADADAQVAELAKAIAVGLDNGENILMYPEGMISRSLPALDGKSLVEQVLKLKPDARIVLSQMNGHLGSSLGAVKSGDTPDISTVAVKRVVDLIKAGVFFMPRRPIHIKYKEVTSEFPKKGTRHEMNTFMQAFLRDGLKAPVYVPYRASEPQMLVEVPYPAMPETKVIGDINQVAPDVLSKIHAKLHEMTGIEDIDNGQELAAHLAMDSLALQDLNLWLESEFGVRNNSPVKTVAEAALIASGQKATTGAKVRPPDGKWIRERGEGNQISLPPGARTLLDAFTYQLKHNPDKVIVSDEVSGPLTYRELATALKLFIPRIEKMGGHNIGVMLPSSVGGVIAYYSILFSGKTPVMVNFTAGETKVKAFLDGVGCKTVLTSQAFVDRLAEIKDIHFPSLENRFVTFEKIREGISGSEKIAAVVASERPGFADSFPKLELDDRTVSAILATSGSKSNPKAVPYNYGMDITNMGDVLESLQLTDRDKLMTMAPLFHSLGLRSITTAISSGVPQVFHSDPTDGQTIAKISELYKPTIIIGTPTFLKGIAWAASEGQLDSYRTGLMGAEKLTKDVVEMLEQKAPNMVPAEGYGMTELSPVVFVNPLESPRLGTLGKPVPSVDVMIVDLTKVAVGQKLSDVVALPEGAQGMLLVAPKDRKHSSVMSGYLNYPGTQPFVEIDGRKWFVTGDLVERQNGDYYKFVSRLERSIKMGGEMVPLDGLEEALLSTLSEKEDKGPVLAILPTPVESNPELVLFTTKPQASVESVNEALRNAGWSKTFRISKVIRVPEIPVLGTGKVDLNPLREMLSAPE